jgi:signal transduction histidine kinase
VSVEPIASRRREVSCLALTFFYDFLESRGFSRREIQEGLPYEPAWLDDRLNWIDYATFLEIERRVAALFPDVPDLFYVIGLTFASTKGLGFTRVVVRGLFSPHTIYSRIPTLVSRFLFPFVTITFTPEGPSSVRGHYVFAPDFPPSNAFIATVRGILAGVPQILGAPPARVHVQRLGSHEVVFDVRISEWTGFFERLRGWVGALSAASRIKLQAVRDAAEELEETNRLLQEKVVALTEAKRALDGRVRDLTLLNALARATTGDLELRPLLRRSSTAISKGLDDAPVALLLAEGDPAGFVVGAVVRVPAAEQRELRTLSSPESPACVKLTRGAGKLRLGTRSWSTTPLLHREHLVGALLVGLPEADTADPALFEAMAGQLAVSIANAQSYQLIGELHDNLEIRVRERTAELEEARTSLQDTVERLEQADRAKSAFFTGVNHDLLTPLTLVLGPLEDLRAVLRAGRTDDLLANVEKAQQNAHELQQLVLDLVDLARLDANVLELARTDLELVGLISEVTETLRPLADKRGIHLTAELSTDPVGVRGDPKLLRRVVVNLIGNALKYSRPHDRVTVRVRAVRGEAELEVQDTGPGIDPADQARIFERFARASTDRTVMGSGIGLTMARDMVAAHGGSIELESAPGAGALFRVRLPLGTAAHDAPVLPAPAPAPRRAEEAVALGDVPPGLELERMPTATSPSPTRTRILVVEDNPEMREFLVQILRRAHHVHAVGDAREAWAIAERDLPDVIVSDVMMRPMDGLTLCKQLKASVATRGIPVLLVSARHGSEAVLDAFAAGADDYVTKPFSPPELLARVDAQVRIRSLAMALLRMEKQYSLGVLSAGIAHELLNPVNAVVNAVPPLRRTVDRLAPDPASREVTQAHALLEAVEVSGRRMHMVVKGILAYTRQDALPRAQTGRLSEEIEAVLTILRYRLSNVKIHRQFAWDEPILHYPEWINQVVMNLLVNALDAIGEEGVIWIDVTKQAQHVHIRVRDSGPGIPPDLRERIFTPFFTTKPPGKGTGLGLAIVREIVAMHRGSIDLDPSVVGGAAFVVSLPVEHGDLAMEA